MSKDENNFIERELGQFKRKYWLAKLLQGVLIFAGTGLVLIGLVALVEYFTWLSVLQRTVLVVLTSAIEIYLLAFYILWPALQILLNGAGLSDTKAAVLIGSKISGISDRLTNYLELKKLGENSELIDASLSQKQALMKDYSFKQAVSLSAIKPFLLFLIPIFTLLLFVWSGNRWFMIEQGADRLLHFSREYQKELPFSIEFESALVVNEGEDYALKFRIAGNVLPQELNIISAVNQQSISMDNGNQFETTFRNCLDDITFQIAYDDILSEEYKLSVIKKALVGRVRIVVEPPAYTKIDPYTIENSLVVEVPQYSQISVLYAFKNTKELDVFYEGQKEMERFTVYQGEEIGLLSERNTVLIAAHKDEELMRTKLNVLLDQRPELDVVVDSTAIGLKLFINASDDYGLTKAGINFRRDGDIIESLKLPFQGALLKSSIELSKEDIAALDELVISVYDAKGVVTQKVDLNRYREKIKSEDQLLKQVGNDIDAISKEENKAAKNDKLSADEAKKSAKNIEKAAKELTKKDSVLYDRFEKLSEEIMKLTEELDKKIPESKKKITEKKLEEKIAELEKEWMILQTIEQLKQLEDSLSKKDGAIEKDQMDKLQKNADELEKEVAKDQKAEDVDWEKFDELEKQNEELKSEEKTNEEGSENKPKQKSGKSSDEVKEKMKENSKELRNQLSMMSDIMMMESTEKNIALIRRLELRALKNSKKEEEVYLKTSNAVLIDKSAQNAQKEVSSSARHILDSLSALTVSDAMLAEVLMENQLKLEENLLEMEKSSPEESRIYSSNQRYLQYGLNDLAAILYDILKSESQSMMDMKAGNKQCNKPKPGKGKKPSLSQQQKELGEKMGKTGKPGKGKEGKQTLSQSELLELIKGQEQILEQYEQVGKDGAGDAKVAEEMNKQLDDLINNNIEKALERNKNIEDKLISLEQSENRKKEKQEERKSIENLVDYEAIKQNAIRDYLQLNQRGTSVVNLPALKNYFTSKWVIINKE